MGSHWGQSPMKGDIMKDIKSLGKVKLSLDEIEKIFRLYNYNDLVDFIKENIEKEIIKPIKSSRLNGKNPALYNAYRVLKDKVDYSNYIDELQYRLNTSLSMDYYLKNLDKYEEDRKYIIPLSSYIESQKDFLMEQSSINERSFEIWGREKFLQKEGGTRILKNLGVTLKDLGIYETTEPLSYYSHHKNTPQNVLILENKDTFYSMRRHLIKGNDRILKMKIGTLIYGRGKGINRSFKDFSICVEPYLNDINNNIYYFGDLDYEGIIIYETLSKIFKDNFVILPFIEAYKCMLKKAEFFELPQMKLGQNKNIGNQFLDSFDEEERNKILDILKENKYIPQEILNSKDF